MKPNHSIVYQRPHLKKRNFKRQYIYIFFFAVPPTQSPATPDLLYHHHSVAANVLNQQHNFEETLPLGSTAIGTGGNLHHHHSVHNGFAATGPDGALPRNTHWDSNNTNGANGNAGASSSACCPRMMPASVMAKINKLNLRTGLYKLVGEFGLRESIYYGSIFLCMTLIVIVCFLVINNNQGGGALSGNAAAMYDSGTDFLILDSVLYSMHTASKNYTKLSSNIPPGIEIQT